MTSEQKQFLEELRALHYDLINSISCDFVRDRALSDSDYIGDSFSEYADSSTSIYYSDQHNYYVEHSEECENALLELYDPDSLADIIKKEGLYHLCCHAGAVGEYMENERELSEDEERIKIILIIDYCLNCDIYLTQEEIEEIAAEDCDRWSDYADLLNEKIKE